MFVPRLTAPSYSDPNWINTAWHGNNPCIVAGSNGSVIPNCTGYTIGRMLELYGNSALQLPWQYNAGEYYPNLKESDIWKKSSKVSLGAIGCYRSTVGSWGHVLIVEQINSDGSIVTSESAWQGSRWFSQTLKPPYYTWNNSFALQGFIYNTKGPTTSSSKIEDFIAKAKSYVGKKAKDLNISDDKYCSAAFIVFCAKTVPDVLGNVIPDKPNSADFASAGVAKGMGTFITGPLYGRVIIPKPGDILLVRTSQTRKYTSQSACDLIYVISDVQDSYIKAIGVDFSGKVVMDTFKDSSKTICGYYRPKWSILNNSTDTMIGYTKLGKFYDTENTAEDATVREVAYLDSSNKPTINKSSVKLSVINYTTLLSSLLGSLLVPSTVSGTLDGEVLVDGVTNTKARECIQFLMGKGLNAAAACGICGNIEAESVPPYNTASIGDYGTSAGICQWHNNRMSTMQQFVGSNWANNLTGQLEYLWYELQTGYKNDTLIPIQGVANTEQGARKAADIFVRNFERPAEPDKQSSIRQNNASKLFNQLTVIMTSTTKSSSTVNISNKAVTGSEVVVPNSVRQAPIDTTYESYSYLYGKWNTSTRQYKVSQLWAQKGKKSNRNIATIDGLYLIALKPVFGYSGDKVSVILSDGTVINCLIADTKGDDSGTNKYGHDGWNGGINIVEWCAIGPTNNNVTNTLPDISGWKGKTVKSIINGGSIL